MVISFISSSKSYQKKKDVLYRKIVFPLKMNYLYLGSTISSLYNYHKTKEVENWYIEYLYNKSHWNLRYVEKRKTVRGVDIFDRLECYHTNIQKEVDDWFFETNSIERQRMNLPPIEQAIKRTDGIEKRELSKWYSVDPEYLNRIKRMLFDQRYLFEPLYVCGVEPKTIFLSRLLRFCTSRYYYEFWNSTDLKDTFHRWIKAKENKEKHAEILAERQEYFVAMRKQNQARRQAAVKTVSDEDNGGWM